MSSYLAKRLPQHRGPAGWSAILGKQPEPIVLDSDTEADFAIVGAGFAGLTAARRLLQLEPQARVVVLEAGRLAEGASGRNSGFMIDLPHDLASDDYAGDGTTSDKALIALNRQAIAFAREAMNEYKLDPAYFDASGKVNGAVSSKGDAHNVSYAQHLDNLGEHSEMLDAQAMHQLTGSRHYTSGLYTPNTVTLQPAGYIRGLGEGLRQQAKVFEESPVTAIEPTASGWQLRTDKATVNASKVILANNGQIESFGIARNRLMHIFLYAVMTPDLDESALEKLGGAPRWGITPADPMGTTVRRIDTAQGGNRIVTRTCASFRPNMQVSAADLNRARAVMQQRFDQRFPQLAGLQMEYAWAGHLCLSKNSVGYTRQLESNLYAACCQNGLGTARGTLSGIAAAEMACSVESDITQFFDEADPSKLPPSPLANIGANAVLRYKEWKAGGE